MIAEGVLVDTSQAQVQLVQQQQHHQQQIQQQQVQMQEQTAMAQPQMQSGPMQSGPMQSGPMDPRLMGGTNGTNGTTGKPGRMNSGDGCCDNARERAKDAVAKVAPCACKLHICIASLNVSIFIYICPKYTLLEIVCTMI